ncbi:DUF350 domain-containing protein [Pseudoalteromonas sp. T1lg65]|uniref:DUF350 domain-containing protein n=1 Tax=Pseudoalteromonas sp. T1lg65 TaxID=2077101 RepID=UPI003F7A6842
MSYLSLANINFLAILACFIIICAFMMMLRFVVQHNAKKLLQEELAQRDNFALGINYASQVTLICVSIAYLFNDLGVDKAYAQPLHTLLCIALVICFIYLGQRIHRNWILYQFNEEREILKQNICAAIVDSGMLIANTILVLGLYHWVHPKGWSDLLVVGLGFCILQILFAIDSKLRESRFAKSNQGASLQQNFSLRNTSIGIRYAGKTIGLALAIYAGLHSAPYHGAKVVENLFSVVLHCGIMWCALYVCSFVLLHISLPKIDIGLEVDHQDNVGIACIEFAVFCSMGYLLINLFSV